MLYNDLIEYSQTGVSYEGSLTLSVPGFSLILLPPSISVYIGDEPDFSNLTSVGLVTIESVKTASITLQATQQQAESMAQTSLIYIVKSADTSLQNSTLEEGSLVQVAVLNSSKSAEQSLA